VGNCKPEQTLTSYPLYLWHVSLFVLAAIIADRLKIAEYTQVPLSMKVAAVAASLALAYLTYRYIELPLRSSPRTKQIACVLCAAMALCGSIAYLISH
jgi:peptidoglycan/LPS O-acetylase OafA/YrhL